MSDSDPNAFGSQPFLSKMAALFESQKMLLDEFVERGTNNPTLEALLRAIADDCTAISRLKEAELLNQCTLIQRALLSRVITACYLIAAGEVEQARYVRDPIIGSAGLPSATPEEIIENARRYDLSRATPELTPSLRERLDVIERELSLPKDPFLLELASIVPSADQILAGSFYGQVFHLGVFQHTASMSGDRIAAHIREEFCSLFLTDIGLLDSVFKALAKRDKAVELSARSSQNWSAGTTLIRRVKEHSLQLTWADGAWERLANLESVAQSRLRSDLAKFGASFQHTYEAGIIVPILRKNRKTRVDVRWAALYFKRALSDLRGVWLLLQKGYTSQAAAIAASLYESALACICLLQSDTNIQALQSNSEGKIPWTIMDMTKMLVRSEGTSEADPRKFENAWRALYAHYVWLCQIKHTASSSALHDTTASSLREGYAFMVAPNIHPEDLPIKALVAIKALTRIHDAIQAFAKALGFENAMPDDYGFATRFNTAIEEAGEAILPYFDARPAISIRDSKFVKKYPPVT